MKTSAFSLFLLFALSGLAQDWKLIKDVTTDQPITATSVDSKGMYYIGTANGSIIRYSQHGEEDEYFSEVNNSAVTSIQTWNQFKVFNFFRDQQSVAVLDRFTTTPKLLDLRSMNLNFAWQFSPGVDHSFWALSTEFRELLKYDDQNLNVLFRIVLPEKVKIESATCLLAFKNLLLLTDEKHGLYVFDQFGKLQGQLPLSGIKDLQIHGELLVTVANNDMISIDPFQLRVVSKEKAPEGAFWSVVIIGDRYIFFSDRTSSIYKRN